MLDMLGEWTQRIGRAAEAGLLLLKKWDADIYLGDTVIGEVLFGKASAFCRATGFNISVGGNQVAYLSRKLGAEIMHPRSESESYCIEISAGVDAAFTTMIVIAVAEN